ncbi:uncharacterized protein LOC126974036 [Leptidea sinapis]|uniref:uncharacterized protein LOC126974036 n=1 Tax=Leptidea sinapis TaxID=189913 RepID=UPI0021C41C7F|nr:uncharacterized protein LOC126974036 [Leptidea sinapis]
MTTSGPLIKVTKLSLEEQIADIEKRKDSKNFKCSLYKCMECFKGFLDERTYSTHMTKHSNTLHEYKNSTYTEITVYCGQFRHPSKKTSYFSHIRIKHPSDFVCELCGHSFVSEKGIESHKNIKHLLDSNEVILS